MSDMALLNHSSNLQSMPFIGYPVADDIRRQVSASFVEARFSFIWREQQMNPFVLAMAHVCYSWKKTHWHMVF